MHGQQDIKFKKGIISVWYWTLN